MDKAGTGNATPEGNVGGDASDGLVELGGMLLTRSSALDVHVGPAVSILGSAWRDTWDRVAEYCALYIPMLYGQDQVDPGALKAAVAAAKREWPVSGRFEHFSDAWCALPLRIRGLQRAVLRPLDSLSHQAKRANEIQIRAKSSIPASLSPARRCS